jgi:hypothetical protein
LAELKAAWELRAAEFKDSVVRPPLPPPHWHGCCRTYAHARGLRRPLLRSSCASPLSSSFTNPSPPVSPSRWKSSAA